MYQQHSIASPVSVVGVGLHSGKRVDLCLKPAPVDAGIVYRRVDLQPPVDIPARATSVGDTRLASTLEGAAGASVQTVEHLMSACYGLGIDNLLVEVNAAELPILDGSAAAFVFLDQTAQALGGDFSRKKAGHALFQGELVFGECEVHDGVLLMRFWVGCKNAALFGHTQQALGNDVFLDFVGASVNRASLGEEEAF